MRQQTKRGSLTIRKQAEDGVNKKILVQLEAALEMSSSRHNAGNREDNNYEESRR